MTATERRLTRVVVVVGAAIIAASSHAQSPVSPSSSRFAVGVAPGIMEVFDVNSDRFPDLVVANEKGNSVSILLGDGKLGFREVPGSPFPAGDAPNDIAVADFNRDGRPDLAVANHEHAHLTVLLGDGGGKFSPAPRSPFAVTSRPHTHGVAAADLNGDGNIDLVTDSWANDRVAILLGDGRGGFSTGPILEVGRHPYQRLRVADLDGDGHVDIVTTNLEGNSVTVLLSDGKGGFHQPPGSPFPAGDSPFNLAIGDVNGDGRPDLAVVNSPSSTSDRVGRDGLTILLGTGRGQFARTSASPLTTAPGPNLVAIGDLDGDGHRSIASN